MSKPTPKTEAEKARDRILRALEGIGEEGRLAILAEACRRHGYGKEARAFYERLAGEMVKGGSA